MPPVNPEYKAVQPGIPLIAGDFGLDLRGNHYSYCERPAGQPHILQYGTQTAPVTVPTFPTAVQDNVEGIIVPGVFGNSYIEMYQTTAQTLMPSIHASKGLEIALDKVDNETVEYIFGGNRASNPLAYTAPTTTTATPDAAVILRCTFEIVDASEHDQFGIFWRKQQNYLVPTSFLTTGNGNYTDFVGFGFSGTAVANLVKSWTDVGTSGSTTVSSSAFAWADNGVHTLEIRIIGRRAFYYINGVQVGDTVRKDGLGVAITAQATTSLPIYNVTAGLQMVPGIFARCGSNSAAAIYLRSWTVGHAYQEFIRQDQRPLV